MEEEEPHGGGGLVSGGVRLVGHDAARRADHSGMARAARAPRAPRPRRPQRGCIVAARCTAELAPGQEDGGGPAHLQ